jgi:RimJ/RimL family protein N-acetyltransferase
MIRLETDRLLFRYHEPTDLAAYCAMESDPQYRAPQAVHPRAHLERRFRDTWLVRKPMGLLATILKASDAYIGRCGLYPRRDESGQVVENEASIAFYLARPYWGQGLATEAGLAFVQYGFQTLGLRRIEAGINAKNLASIRVVEKLGFRSLRSGADGETRWHDFELCAPGIQRGRYDNANAALRRAIRPPDAR